MSWRNLFDRRPRMDGYEAIKRLLPTVMELMKCRFAEAGEIAPDSALAQVGLIDGDQTVLEYLDHGEAGIAFEHLLYMIREATLPISRDTYDTIASIGISIGIPETQWTDLCPTQ